MGCLWSRGWENGAFTTAIQVPSLVWELRPHIKSLHTMAKKKKKKKKKEKRSLGDAAQGVIKPSREGRSDVTREGISRQHPGTELTKV